MNISNHKSLFSVASIMRLTPFDSFIVKRFNSQIFFEFIWMQGHRNTNIKTRIQMMMKGRRKQLSTKFEHQFNPIFMKEVVNEVWDLVEGSS